MIQCKYRINIGGENMCLLNYNKEQKKYKHLTYTERTMIERWYNREHLSKKEIAKHTPPEKSIENRPKEANERSEYGHWEGDLVIGNEKRETYY